MNVKTFKPVTEPVEDDAGNCYVLRNPDEAAYCAWEDARLNQATFDGSGKQIKHTGLYGHLRALAVGACLYNGEEKPVGEEFVRKTFEPASISKMYDWLMANGLGATEKDAKNS